MTETNGRFRAQEVDYLGFLEAKLRDLHGIATLVYELVQNADDARDEQGHPATRRICFDVADAALVVENDSIFREVDFVRLQTIASGGKRTEAGTIGAFGLGFVAVYQVTDRPEIVSNGRCWTIDPTQPADRRIHEQDVALTPGTQFRLPWATNPTSDVRQRLRLTAVDPHQLEDLTRQIGAALPLAALFLQQLTVLELKRNGQLVRRIEREAILSHELVLHDATQTTTWHLLPGDFVAEAARLRSQHPQIEPQRHSDVVIALPHTPLANGRLFAGLPSETAVALPLHLNGDFYPTTDRKHIHFGQDYQAAWNRAIISCAAQTLADALPQLPGRLGPQPLWQLLQQAAQLAQEPAPDPSFAAFWSALLARLPAVPLLYTAQEQWVLGHNARLWPSMTETAVAPLLIELGLPLVHADLRPYFSLMRQPDVGVPLLQIDDLAATFTQAGLTQPTPLAAAPAPLNNPRSWPRLWDLLDGLLLRAGSSATAAQAITRCAIALCQDGVLRLPERVARGDAATQALFASVAWLHEQVPPHSLLWRLVPEFDAAAAINHLAQFTQAELEEGWYNGRFDPAALFHWLEARQIELLADPVLRQRLLQLPIGPTAGGLYPLAHLALPGGFEDPLQRTFTINLDAASERHLFFLQDLGVQTVTFTTYLSQHLPRLLTQHRDIPSDARHRLVALLAARLGEFRDDVELQQTLNRLPLVPTLDGHFRPAAQTYAQREVFQILGESVYVAEPVESEAVAALQRWLGVAQTARPADVLARVQTLIQKPPTTAVRRTLQLIFHYLASHWASWPASVQAVYEPLQTLAWLPGMGETSRWFAPPQLYSTLQRELFASQALFLAVPDDWQTTGAAFLHFLGMPTTPDPELVVAHLRQTSRQGQPVSEAVYAYLAELNDRRVWDGLREEAVVPVGNGRYAPAQHVFWQPHAYGRFRYQLDPGWRPYSRLFAYWGVRETADITDGLAVLLEIGRTVARPDVPLEAAALAVVNHCWQQLDAGWRQQAISQAALAELGDWPVVPDGMGVLQRPLHLLFNDQPDIAARLPALARHLLPLPPRSPLVWTAVGVRRLRAQSRVMVLEQQDALADPFLAGLLAERAELLGRVAGAESSQEAVRALLARLQVVRVTRLAVAYEVELAGQVWQSEMEGTTAVLTSDESVLYGVYAGEAVPWTAVARQLALAFKPEPPQTSLALAIKEVLTSPTVDDAHRTLDELGYPVL